MLREKVKISHRDIMILLFIIAFLYNCFNLLKMMFATKSYGKWFTKISRKIQQHIQAKFQNHHDYSFSGGRKYSSIERADSLVHQRRFIQEGTRRLKKKTQTKPHHFIHVVVKDQQAEKSRRFNKHIE